MECNPTVNKKKELFAATFTKICAWSGKKYCWPSMEKARKLCKKWFHVDISERSGSRYMSQLVEEKVFFRKRRRPRSVRGQIQTQSSLTFLKVGAFKVMGRLRILGGVLDRLSDAPKMAYNLFKQRESHLRYVDNLSEDDSSRVKGAPSAVFRTA